MWAELARTGNAFALDFGNNMVGNTGYILTVPSNNQDELLYLLAFLNSRSMLYSLNQITTRFDENGWRWLRQFVEQLRVPPLINKNEILSIVATVTKDNKQEVSEILNNVIADIYNFTDEEKSVHKSNPFELLISKERQKQSSAFLINIQRFFFSKSIEHIHGLIYCRFVF